MRSADTRLAPSGVHDFTGRRAPAEVPTGSASRLSSYPYNFGCFGLGYGRNGLGYGAYFLYAPFFDYRLHTSLEIGLLGGFGGIGKFGGGDNYSPAAAKPTPADGRLNYFAAGEADFQAGAYDRAIVDWKHALVDNPRRAGELALLIGQALFAQGQFEPAAGAIQAGMNLLPPERWGKIVSDPVRLYGASRDFDQRLTDLKIVGAEHPTPAKHFLLGYIQGYRGDPRQAVRELDETIQSNPLDPFAAMLRNEFGAKLGLANVPIPPPGHVVPGEAGEASPRRLADQGSAGN